MCNISRAEVISRVTSRAEVISHNIGGSSWNPVTYLGRTCILPVVLLGRTYILTPVVLQGRTCIYIHPWYF